VPYTCLVICVIVLSLTILVLRVCRFMDKSMPSPSVLCVLADGQITVLADTNKYLLFKTEFGDEEIGRCSN